MSNVRITVACPDALRPAANQLAMVLAHGPLDANTYGGLNWQDTYGDLYACASFEARPEWIMAAQSQLVRPAWDVDSLIDMDAAATAQDAIVLWVGVGDIPTAATGKLTAVAHPEPMTALAAMGLVAVPFEL